MPFSMVNRWSRKSMKRALQEEKRKETIAEVYREDDCSSFHKFTLSALQRTLRDLRFVE
jgi:hypothetical protein